jgi:hypothetical protein
VVEALCAAIAGAMASAARANAATTLSRVADSPLPAEEHARQNCFQCLASGVYSAWVMAGERGKGEFHCIVQAPRWR